MEKKNIATTNRPTEYVGTIALDSITAGQSIEELIENIVPSYIEDGFRFNGLKIYTGHPHDINSENNNLVGIVLSKNNNTNQENIIVEREINLLEIIHKLTAISIQFTNKTDFEGDKIDWNNLTNPEE